MKVSKGFHSPPATAGTEHTLFVYVFRPSGRHWPMALTPAGIGAVYAMLAESPAMGLAEHNLPS